MDTVATHYVMQVTVSNCFSLGDAWNMYGESTPSSTLAHFLNKCICFRFVTFIDHYNLPQFMIKNHDNLLFGNDYRKYRFLFLILFRPFFPIVALPRKF